MICIEGRVVKEELVHRIAGKWAKLRINNINVARHFCQSDHSIHDLPIIPVEKIHRNDVNLDNGRRVTALACYVR